jgi:hypothetical protein
MDTKEAKPKRAKREGKVSYAGRPEFIAKCVADGMEDKSIVEAVKAKYPGSSSGRVAETIKAKRKAAKAEEKSETAEAK